MENYYCTHLLRGGQETSTGQDPPDSLVFQTFHVLVGAVLSMSLLLAQSPHLGFQLQRVQVKSTKNTPPNEKQTTEQRKKRNLIFTYNTIGRTVRDRQHLNHTVSLDRCTHYKLQTMFQRSPFFCTQCTDFSLVCWRAQSQLPGPVPNIHYPTTRLLLPTTFHPPPNKFLVSQPRPTSHYKHTGCS